MEQAVNQFNKGLLSDTHPMVLGNDTLSDALNATFVTMNGNEVVLLNDMGNRRVDNAFLPSGFEPVGIKEYGGIIYVASYNPITNRSLIGSFPSPERKINSLDDKSLGADFDFFNSFIPKGNNNEIRFISTDTVMLPLTGDTSLHAGDKFIIYSDINIEDEWKDYVSNCYNINPLTNIIDSKNKHITLYAGVLNSQNEFVDITKTLKRWKNGEIMKYDDSYSDEYIFNDGYFINSSLFEGDLSSYTIDDRQLIKERLTKPANTYAYKLTGPLYLKAQLNHILEFNFNISGDKNKDGCKLNLVITADITYNCPDEYKNGHHAFDFYIEKDGLYIKCTNIDGVSITYLYQDDPVYSNDLYKRTVTANVTIKYNPDKFDENEILKYFIGVDSGIPLQFIDNHPYYIETLSQYGEIDLSKLNTGEVELKAFRFFNSNESTTITYITESYPRIGQTFSNFKIYLVDVLDENEEEITIPISDIVLNGKGISSFDWDSYKIESNKLYIVYFYCDVIENGLKIKDLNMGQRWLLTTELFNDCYNPSSPNFVEDYQDRIIDMNNEEYDSIIENIDEKLIKSNTILYNKLQLDFEAVYNSEVSIKWNNSEHTGKLICKKEENINYKTKDQYIVKQLLDDYIDIVNRNLYPEIDLYNNKLNVSDDNNISIDKSNLEIEYIKNGKSSTLNLNDENINIDDLILHDVIINGNEVTININCNNILLSEGNYESSNKSVNDGFYKLNSKNFKEDVLKNSVSNTGFCVSNLDMYNEDDYHLFGLIFDKKYYSYPIRVKEDFVRYCTKYFNDFNEDDELHLDFNDSRIKELYSIMNNIPDRYSFAFIFSAINMVGGDEDDEGGKLPLAYVSDPYVDGLAGLRDQDEGRENENIDIIGYCPITCCKVWWRNGIADEWVLLNNKSGVFGGNNNTNDRTNKFFGKKYNGKNIFVGGENWEHDNYTKKSLLDIYDVLYNGTNTEGYGLLDNNGYFLINGVNYIGNIRGLVFDQIIKFLDLDKKIVYDMYKTTNLLDNGLRTIDKNNHLYNKPYSGDINVIINYNIPKFKVISSLDDTNPSGQYVIINPCIKTILPFHVSSIKNLEEKKISVSIKSNEEFEDDVDNIMSNDVINNIYLENGTFRDINDKKLSGDTIYKIIEENGEFKGLKPLDNPPYRVYKNNGLNSNSLVSTSNYLGASSEETQYLRASGEEDSRTSLRFAGGNLRVVDEDKIKNLL